MTISSAPPATAIERAQEDAPVAGVGPVGGVKDCSGRRACRQLSLGWESSHFDKLTMHYWVRWTGGRRVRSGSVVSGRGEEEMVEGRRSKERLFGQESSPVFFFDEEDELSVQ
jgi:hypothetical protein